ncbi:MAG: DUF3369 domain-containing protein, partial [Gammaproteobacteria bacterium]|nr:DUF3369 domain-containing protein [Gammaproteobacteria bacterium]
ALVLKNFTFDGRGIEILTAYSGREAEQILEQQSDIATILLDVVMESDDAGLKVVIYLREVLENSTTRVILRTGQPGLAPEQQVITQYDINDYKDKSELTRQKLFSAVITSLRGYRDLINLEQQRKVIDNNRKGLEKIITASDSIFEVHSLQQFAEGVLLQLQSILGVNIHSVYAGSEGFSMVQESQRDDFRVMAATGSYKSYSNNGEQIPEKMWQKVLEAVKQRQTLYGEDHIVCYIENQAGGRYILFLEGENLDLDEAEKDLVNIFSRNISIAFDNIRLSDEVEATQREVINRLSEVLEMRSDETGHHAKRVGKFTQILAQACELPVETVELYKDAAPLHDVGKVAIPDYVLNKPAALSDSEFETMKTHAELGHKMFADSERLILQTAASIALEHHERIDGSGYPRGIKGDEISLAAKIVAVTDVFDALSHDRVYRKAWPMDDILALFQRERGKGFDAKIVDLLFANIDKFTEVLETLE